MSASAMSWAWKQSVGGNEKLVLLALADQANDDGEVWPGHKTIAKKCGIGEKTVRRVLQKMKDAKLLDWQQEVRDTPLGVRLTSNRYKLALPGVLDKMTDRPSGQTDRRARRSSRPTKEPITVVEPKTKDPSTDVEGSRDAPRTDHVAVFFDTAKANGWAPMNSWRDEVAGYINRARSQKKPEEIIEAVVRRVGASGRPLWDRYTGDAERELSTGRERQAVWDKLDEIAARAHAR